MFENLGTLDPVTRDPEELKKVNKKDLQLYERYKLLEIILPKSEPNKPMIPQLRLKDYFKQDDEIHIFEFEPYEARGKLTACTVKEVDDNQFIIPLVRFTTSEDLLGYRLNSGYVIPSNDFEYLKENKEFRDLWLDYTRPVITQDIVRINDLAVHMFFEKALRTESGEKDFMVKTPRDARPFSPQRRRKTERLIKLFFEGGSR